MTSLDDLTDNQIRALASDLTWRRVSKQREEVHLQDDVAALAVADGTDHVELQALDEKVAF